jgi:CRP-like cAMP-binding protein
MIRCSSHHPRLSAQPLYGNAQSEDHCTLAGMAATSSVEGPGASALSARDRWQFRITLLKLGAAAGVESECARHNMSSIAAPQDPRQNHLLRVLPEVAFERVRAQLELVPMPLGHVLYESGRPLRHVYFPTTCIVSLLYVMADGASAEIAVVGNEGIVGISLFMGGETTPSRALVQSAGHAYRLKSQVMKEEFTRGAALQHLLLRYTQALLTQMAQTAVCNRHHSVEQQLCRWLLLSMDRLPSNRLTMTQELIANMLGVRREGVTAAAGKLQAAGLIRYSRGQITVLDRPRLEAECCECYQVVKTEFDRLLPDAIAT